MATYLELKAKAEKLLQEAEALRQQELAEVIQEIKTKMAEYGITVADLGGTAKPKAKTGKKVGAVAPKYRNPQTGETWSGRGRAPKWLEGKNKEDFAIEG